MVYFITTEAQMVQQRSTSEDAGLRPSDQSRARKLTKLSVRIVQPPKSTLVEWIWSLDSPVILII